MTGIICLSKPQDMTSFSAVARVRRIVGEKKAGHAGTLDPMATGVLPILLGGATRFLEFLPTSPKRYLAVFRLGVRTDTLDCTGTILQEQKVTCTRAEVEQALASFRGEQLQIPPMYSAIKKDGVRMYDLARRGIEVEREARPITIYALELKTEEQVREAGVSLQPLTEQEYCLDVTCSAGTYIRTLIDDLGTALGCGAVMTQLVRTQVGDFLLEQAVTLEELERAAEQEILEERILSVPEALQRLTAVTVSGAQANRFRNGGELNLDRIPALRAQAPQADALLRVFDPDGVFLGLGKAEPEAGLLTVKRVFVGR